MKRVTEGKVHPYLHGIATGPPVRSRAYGLGLGKEKGRLPVYPGQRTRSEPIGLSQMCQLRKSRRLNRFCRRAHPAMLSAKIIVVQSNTRLASEIDQRDTKHN
jgi:hypothetical protein